MAASAQSRGGMQMEFSELFSPLTEWGAFCAVGVGVLTVSALATPWAVAVSSLLYGRRLGYGTAFRTGLACNAGLAALAVALAWVVVVDVRIEGKPAPSLSRALFSPAILCMCAAAAVPFHVAVAGRTAVASEPRGARWVVAATCGGAWTGVWMALGLLARGVL
jgi:hypothetical protein